LGAVQPAGWLRAQLQRDLEHGFASRLDQLTTHAANDLFTHRIGSIGDEIAWWDSETRGNWLWGYLMMAYLAGDAQHIARVNQHVADLKATQDADGYIGIYVPAARYQHTGENGELWGQSRALLTLLTHYELTGDAASLQAVEAAAQLTMRHYGRHNPYFNRPGADYVYGYATGVTHGLNYVDVVEWLYRLTGNSAYRDFGVWLYQDFSSIVGRFTNDDMALRSLNHAHIPFAGHAVHTAEHLRVLFFAAQMSDDPDIQAAVPNAMRKLGFYTVPSGALIGDESIHGTAHPEMGYEYCTLTELAHSLISGLQKWGSSSFGDWVENLTFNAAQGARFADGTALCYLSMENRLAADTIRPDAYQVNRFSGSRYKYSPTHEDIAVCCNPNAVRLLPYYVAHLWMKTADGIVAALYGASTLTTDVNGVQVTIEEQTEYPFSDTITFTITPAAPVEFALYLRKPAWTSPAQITASGVTISEEGGFYVLRKRWTNPDQVTLTFTPSIQAVLNVNSEYAIRRGALQYVMPIAYRAHAIKDYAVADFHDYTVLPVDLVQAYQTPILDLDQPNLGLQVQAHEDTNIDQPWDSAPLVLKGAAGTFVPMGCTVLRRSTFPAALSATG